MSTARQRRVGVLVTGAAGFMGRNLSARLRALADVRLLRYTRDDGEARLAESLRDADVVFHLAGVNRPRDEREFERGNVGLTARLCEMLRQQGRRPRIVFASSVHAATPSPYGRSKCEAEAVLTEFAADSGADVVIYRLANVFGKWCRPNYNSVVATFCHNIARDLPITITDPDRELELVYIDDVIEAWLPHLECPVHRRAANGAAAIPAHCIRLGELAERIRAFRSMKATLEVPDFSLRFNQQLYATYLSYVDRLQLDHGLAMRQDDRGSLAEFLRSPSGGQVFLSYTGPGVTRGNHYHHTKAEKFLVVGGEGLIRLRHIESEDIVEFLAREGEYRVVDIPPGYTHSITNVGDRDLITLFWSSEVFDSQRPDTWFEPVEPREGRDP